MKLVSWIIVCLILFTSQLYSQLSSFEKTYESELSSFSGYQITKAGNDFLLIAGYGHVTKKILKILKVDEYGNLAWSREYQSSQVTSGTPSPMLKISDSEYWLITTDEVESLKRIKLIRIDDEGNIIDTNVYSGSYNEYGFQAVKNGENYIIVGAKKINSFSYKALKIINVDSNGNEIRQKELNFSSSNSTGIQFQKYNDSIFIAVGSDSLIFINDQGEILKSLVPDERINSAVIKDGNILLGGPNHFSLYNYEGELLWKAEGSSNGRTLNYNNNNEFIVYTGGLQDKSLTRLNINGELVSKVPIRGMITGLIYDGDNYFATGIFDALFYYLKMDENFDYSALDLLNPNGGEHFILDEQVSSSIEWYSYNISSIDIEFSSDNGQTWLTVAEDISALDEEVNWTIPDINSTECLIRITDSYNGSMFDQSANTFEMTPVYSNEYNFIAANNLIMWLGNNGMSSHDPYKEESGLYWPGGFRESKAVGFAEGLVWGGKVGNEIRVNGSTYRYGLTPGAILDDGTPDDPDKPENRIYKLISDWENSLSEVDKEIYQFNYDNWPGQHGAPYTDIDNDGVFTRGIDEPKIIGEETLFYVSNDLDVEQTAFTYGTLPMGIEYQQTVYGYNTEELKDVVFKKVNIINKSNETIEDMYIAYWADDDLGFAIDDYVGCDTVLSLAYTYNGDNMDDDYYGEAPPAVGRVLLQGPVTEAEKESAIVNGENRDGYRNLPMASFMMYLGGSAIYSDPDMGVAAGAEQFYNNFQGLIWDGSEIIDPNNSTSTNYVLSGDPVEQTGWYEGEGWTGGPRPGDRRSVVASGPFNFEPGDTQLVVFAIFVARGSDNINSVAKLKEKARELHEFWGNDIPVAVEEIASSQLPAQYSLSQNYPNPFNPTTTIEYKIPSPFVIPVSSDDENRNLKDSSTDQIGARNDIVQVELIVYDILGREVATLVNERQKPGTYRVKFDGTGLSSGLYFYQLKSGNVSQTNKMILIK